MAAKLGQDKRAGIPIVSMPHDRKKAESTGALKVGAAGSAAAKTV